MDLFRKPLNFDNATAASPSGYPADGGVLDLSAGRSSLLQRNNSTLKHGNDLAVIVKAEDDESHCKEMNNEEKYKVQVKNDGSAVEQPSRRFKDECSSTFNNERTKSALHEDNISRNAAPVAHGGKLVKDDVRTDVVAPGQSGNSSTVVVNVSSILRAALLQGSGRLPPASQASGSPFLKAAESSSTSAMVQDSSKCPSRLREALLQGSEKLTSASQGPASPFLKVEESSSSSAVQDSSRSPSPPPPLPRMHDSQGSSSVAMKEEYPSSSSVTNEGLSDDVEESDQSEPSTQLHLKPPYQLGKVKRTLNSRTSSNLPILTVPKVRLSRNHAGESSSSWSHLPADPTKGSEGGYLVYGGLQGSSGMEADWEGVHSTMTFSATGTSASEEESTSADSVSMRPSLLQMALEHGSSQVNSEETKLQVTKPTSVGVCPILPINPKSPREVKHHNFKTREKRYYQCQFCEIIYEQARKLERHMKDPVGKAPYQCCYCEQTFPTQGCRRFHSRLHEDKTLPCPFCEKIFNEKRRFEDHVRSHTGEAPFMCQECGNVYRTRSALRIHKRTHGSDKPLQCRFCPKRFIRIGDVQVHERTHTGEKPYKCGICTSSFATSSQVNRHRRTHSEDRPHECAFCNKTFKNPDYLTTHQKMHLGLKPHCCKFCPKTFRTPRELVHHERVHTGEKPYACEECGHRFSKKTNLKQHELQHTGIKSFKCSHCPKSFFRKSSMTWHEKIHENQERFTCKECGKLFFKESSRDKHIKTTHCEDHNDSARAGDEEETDEKYGQMEESSDAHGLEESAGNSEGTPPKETSKKSPAKSQTVDPADTTCEECGKTFLARKSLLRHLRAIHNKFISKNGEGESPKGKKLFTCRHCPETLQTDHLRHVHEASHTNETFTCDTCNKIFATRQLLVKHQKIHSDVKPHVCETCGSAFTIKWYLNRHMNVVHSNVYSYSCKICNKQFKAKTGLSVHMQLHNIEGTNYKCDLCAAVFQVKRYLARHKRRYHRQGVGAEFSKGKGKSKKKIKEEDPEDPLSDFEDTLDDDFDIMKDDSQAVSGVFLRQMLSSGSEMDKRNKDSKMQNRRSDDEFTWRDDSDQDFKVKDHRRENYLGMHGSIAKGLSSEQDGDMEEENVTGNMSNEAFGEEQSEEEEQPGEFRRTVDFMKKRGPQLVPRKSMFIERGSALLHAVDSPMFPFNDDDDDDGDDDDEELFNDELGLRDGDDKDDEYVADEDTMSDYDDI